MTEDRSAYLPCDQCGCMRYDVGYYTAHRCPPPVPGQPIRHACYCPRMALCTPCAEGLGLEDVTERTAILSLPSVTEDILELTDSDLIQLLEEPEA
jgi:hypothetical protein